MKYLLLSFLLALVACQSEDGAAQSKEDLTAKNVDTATCAACGMVVREQPAPRGQVIHRDGSREFFCSIDDLVQYLDVPSPKGRPRKVFAEVLPDEHAMDDMNPSWQEWDEADALYFVTGVERPGVMGAPSLTYRTKESAENAAEEFKGAIVTFEQLRKQNKK